MSISPLHHSILSLLYHYFIATYRFFINTYQQFIATYRFFGLLKSQLLYLQKFKSVDHFREKLEAYLNYYNEDRIKIKLGGKSPVQYRLQHQAKAS